MQMNEAITGFMTLKRARMRRASVASWGMAKCPENTLGVSRC